MYTLSVFVVTLGVVIALPDNPCKDLNIPLPFHYRYVEDASDCSKYYKCTWKGKARPKSCRRGTSFKLTEDCKNTCLIHRQRDCCTGKDPRLIVDCYDKGRILFFNHHRQKPIHLVAIIYSGNRLSKLQSVHSTHSR